MPAYIRSGAVVTVNSQTTGNQVKSSVTRLADGSLIVVWHSTDTTQDGSGSAIKMQRYSASGALLGAEVTVNSAATADQTLPQVTGLANGGFVVTWETADTAQDGNGTAIKAQIFDASGVATGTEFRVNTLSTANQQQPTIVGLSDGGFVAVWQTTDTTQDGAGWAIKAQRFDASGTALGSEFLVNTSASGSQNNADVAALANGGFVVTWQVGNSSSSEIYAQAYGADGVKTGNQFMVTAGFGSAIDSAVTALAGGGFVVTWGAQGVIWAQQFDAARAKVGAAINVGSGYTPDITTLADGGFVVSWHEGAIGGIMARTYSAAGVAGGAAFPVYSDSGAIELDSALVSLAGGGFAVVWTNEVAGNADIRLQRYIANTAPELGDATRSVSVSENTVGVTSVAATDDGGPSPLSYSIVGGADAARFAINAATGFLSFVSARNYEAPADANGDNVYEVIVRASDSDLADTQILNVTVTNVNEGVSITSNGGGAAAAITTSENIASVTTVTAVDADGDTVTYAVTGGADAALFAIDAATGALSFLNAPSFETPGDADGDNVYQVTVRATDGVWADTQTLSVTVANLNETVSITSNGGAASAAIATNENSTAVTTVAAVDIDGDLITFAVVGGADAGLFAINATTGALGFVNAPNFEAPGDADGNNIYDVIVSASDGSFVDTQAIAVAVSNANEGVTITSGATGSVVENGAAVATVTASDVDGDTVSFAISGGADSALFVIDASTGALSFVNAPNFEAPADADGDNLYDVIVSATDGSFTDTRSLAVSVTNANEGFLPGWTSGARTSIENQTLVGLFTATDIDGDAVSYSITDGDDAALFTIDSVTGALSFVSAPDYENPASAAGTNTYSVFITASDGSISEERAFSIIVGNDNEGLTITSDGGGSTAVVPVTENGVAVTTVAAVDLDGTAPSYAIIGGDDAARFGITSEGGLYFLSAPDFEAPADADGDNVYDVIVSASDGYFSDTQSLSVAVTNANEGVTITAHGGGDAASLAIAENGTAVATITAVDADGTPVTYAIAGGADAALFTINTQTGALSFSTAPNFEAPADADADNVYDVIVSASDGTLSDVQTLSVAVTNMLEGNTIMGTSGNNTISTTNSPSGQPRATQLEDTIFGLGGADTILAAGGNDIIDGGSGNDTITGGAGADAITGGTGADRFVYTLISDSSAGAADIITDFSRAQGDRISLSTIDANANSIGNQSFAFIGTAAFSNVAGQLRYEQVGGNTFVSGDVNGDGVADIQIQLNGLVTLQSSDFLL